jgi:hypothetical protein
MKLIPLDAVLAEIERIKEMYCYDKKTNASFVAEAVINSINNAINSLEVKEVDLEKELIKWHKEHFQKSGTFIGMSGFYLTNSSQMELAKHFFELGLKASNPLTWKDIKLIWNITDEMDNMPEKDFFKELLKRFKALKGNNYLEG